METESASKRRRSGPDRDPRVPLRVKWLAVAATTIALAASAGLASRVAPEYEASAIVRIEFTEISPDFVRWDPIDLARKRVKQIRESLNDQDTLTRMAARAGLHAARDAGRPPEGISELDQRISETLRLEVLRAGVGEESGIAHSMAFAVSFRDQSAAFARQVADAIADGIVSGAGAQAPPAPAAAMEQPVSSPTLEAAIVELTKAARRVEQADRLLAEGAEHLAQLGRRKAELFDRLNSLAALRVAETGTAHGKSSPKPPSADADGAMTALSEQALDLQRRLREIRSAPDATPSDLWHVTGALAIAHEQLGHARIIASGPTPVPERTDSALSPGAAEETDKSPRREIPRDKLKDELASLNEALARARGTVERRRQSLDAARSGLAQAEEQERSAQLSVSGNDSGNAPGVGKPSDSDGIRYVLEAPASVREILAGPEQMAVVGYGALVSLALGVGVIPLAGLWGRSRRSERKRPEPVKPIPETQDHVADSDSPESSPESSPDSELVPPVTTEAPVSAAALPPPPDSEKKEHPVTRKDDIYERHFGLSGKPFSLLPDPAFLYMSKQHSLSFAMLQYGLANNAGLTVLTGEIGCGKTTLLRHLLNEIDEDLTVGMLTNTHPSFRELLQWISAAFGLEYEGRGKVALHQAFVDFMIDEYRQGRRTVLIVDEAQNMSPATLEELRMLSNVNVDDHLLLQLVFVGQPQLRRTLARPDLVQVAQRIAADYSLGGFEERETREYIAHRLGKVGGDPAIFAEGTHELIHRSSGGIPRIINVLCDTGLVYAYGSQQQEVQVDLMAEVIRDRDQLRGISSLGPSSVEAAPASGHSAPGPTTRKFPNHRSARATLPTAVDSPLLSAFDDAPELSADDARELFTSLRRRDSPG